MAGHETTSNTCSWALYLLSRHPEVCSLLVVVFIGLSSRYKNSCSLKSSRLRVEINHLAWRKSSKCLCFAMFSTCVSVCTFVVDEFVQESLRLFPTVPVFARVANETHEVFLLLCFRRLFVCMQLFGYRVPKNALVVFQNFAMCKNPEIWAEPLRFLPERFDEKSKYYRKFTINDFFPFSSGIHSLWSLFSSFCLGVGERNCIGQRLALLEGPMLIALVVRRFRLFPGNSHFCLLLFFTLLFQRTSLGWTRLRKFISRCPLCTAYLWNWNGVDAMRVVDLCESC